MDITISVFASGSPFDRDEYSVRWAENTRQALRHSLDICVHKVNISLDETLPDIRIIIPLLRLWFV